MLLHHTVTGSGPALLLLHSTTADSRQWDGQRAALAETWTVLTPDFRGYGATPLPDEPFCHARDVLALLDHLEVETTALVASSGGGHVALQVASAEPSRVQSLVLLCAAAGGVEPTDDMQAFARREQMLWRAGDIDAAAEHNVTTWLGPDADDAARALLREMQRHAFEVQLAAGDPGPEEEDLDVDLARITAPTTVVSGRHDLDFFGLVARYLTAGLPNARHVELAWAGHLPNLERPEETTTLIKRAVNGLR